MSPHNVFKAQNSTEAINVNAEMSIALHPFLAQWDQYASCRDVVFIPGFTGATYESHKIKGLNAHEWTKVRVQKSISFH